MPRYDYECTKCGNRFELKQSFDSDPFADCPNCAGQANRRFHSVPIVFKGSGWYVNDYGKKGSSSTSTPGSDDSDSKADSKPKAETKSESAKDSKAKPKKESVASKKE